ncbi:MAG: hypothetical protein K2G09_07490 [Paramuribaculum sp.]|nr:hypothetical protein [Paramuribaculum sp.]
MLRIDRICSILFIFAFALLIPSVKFATFIDELIAGLLGALAIADCIINRSWRRYTLMWIIIAIMTFYAIYSLIFLNYNTPAAIATDWIIQLKPYIPFVVFLAVKPTFSGKQKQWLRYIAIFNAIICTLSFFMPKAFMATVMGHISYPGIVLLISALIYAFTAEHNRLSKPDILVIVTMLSAGILCGRSKYFGEFVTAIFFLFFYRASAFKYMSLKRRIIILTVPLLVMAVGWSKFRFYFLTGTATTYDPEVIESFARPVLYVTGALIFINNIPFGSGLASFCSWASADPYSSLYHEYGISSVYGLSPTVPDFICDAFYPSLAQFGIAGTILFIIFWIYVARLLKKVIRQNPQDNRILFACGWIIILTILIESIASTTFVQTSGMCAMMLLGAICSTAYPSVIQLKKQENEN